MESIKIKYFGKQEIILLRTEIQSALDNIKAKYEISELTLDNINFNATSFTAKITGTMQNADTENYKQSEAEFFAMRNGLPLDLIGSEFVLEGAIYKITDLVTSRPKYPITAHSAENGKTFRFTVQRIKELLDKFRVINITYQDIEPNSLTD